MTSNTLPADINDFLTTHPDVETAELMIPDINGILRGKRIGRDEFSTAFGKGLNLPGSTVLLDARGDTFDNIRFGAHDGDPDVVCQYVPGSVAPVPWSKIPLMQAMVTMRTQQGEPFWPDPRNVLKSVLAHYHADGLTPVIALELEFYLLDGTCDAPEPRLARVPGTSLGMDGPNCCSLDELADNEIFLNEVERTCQLQAIPVGTALSEFGPGQFEINLHHVNDAVLACDQAALLKRVVKNVALRHGMVASFMAKPFADFTGCGLHMHTSVLDRDGHNIFATPTNSQALVSDTLRHAIGGLGQTMAESMAIFAPNPNSYRRFKPGFFAPVNPSWGINHRSLSLRIPMSGNTNKRVEHRVAGADANPYLVAAAILAGIHHGMKHSTDPGPMVAEGGDAPTDITLPLRLGEAVDKLEAATVLPEYLGKLYVDTLASCRREESDRFNAQVSNRDYEWYLRNI